MIKVSFGKKLGTLGILVWAEWLKISGEKKGAQGILLKWDGKRVKREEMLSAACSKIIKIFLWSWAQRTPPGIWVHVFSGSWVKILESLTASLPVRCGDTVLTFKDVAFQACLFGGTLVGVAIDTKNHHYIHPSICMLFIWYTIFDWCLSKRNRLISRYPQFGERSRWTRAKRRRSWRIAGRNRLAFLAEPSIFFGEIFSDFVGCFLNSRISWFPFWVSFFFQSRSSGFFFFGGRCLNFLFWRGVS